MATGSAILEAAIPTNMSRDWVSVISSKIRIPFNSEAVVDALHKVNVCDSLQPEDRQTHLVAHLKDVTKWRHRLSSVSGHRSGLLYRQVFLASGDSRYVDRLLSRFDNILTKKKNSFQTSYSIKTIFSAIASSPFRDTANASRAFDCSTAEAIDYCILSCRNPALRTAVFHRIVSGVRTGVASFHCEWHPNVLSWFQNFCLETTIQQCMDQSVRSAQLWDTL